MVEGFDAAPTADVPFPALAAVNRLGGLEGATFVFAALAPLKTGAKGKDVSNTDPADDEGADELNDAGLPVKALTVAQARKHYCEKNEIDPEKYSAQSQFFTTVPEADVLRADGYTIVDPSEKKKE